MIRWKIAQNFELRWWKNYLKRKNIHEYLAWKEQYWADFFNKINEGIEIKDTTKILDAGCGPAGIYMLFKNNCVTAIDPLLDAYEKNLPHFRREMYPNVRFTAMTIEELQKQNKYDLVFCINAINHVADLYKSLDRLSACTKENGFLIISTDVHRNSLLKRLFQLIPGDILHPHQYDRREYENMLKERGFNIIKTIKIKSDFVFDYYVWVARKAR